MTLRDIHDALGAPRVFAIGMADDNPRCLIEQAANHALKDALDDAGQRPLKRFGEVTLGEIQTVASSRNAF